VRTCAELTTALEGALPVEASVGFCEFGSDDVDTLPPLPTPPTWGERRRRDFGAGREAARIALAKFGLAGEVGRDPDGVPVFPEGVSGSITHTGRRRTRAFAVVSPGLRFVGIDAEERRELEPELIAYILSEEELVDLPFSQQERSLAALAAFSAKESFYKCVYPEQRKFIGFREVTIQARALSSFEWDCVLVLESTGLERHGKVMIGQDVVLSTVWDVQVNTRPRR
jgi:4'-phosphopantetheinyl transferase EntD